MTTGPTKGAAEGTGTWQASPAIAIAVRGLVLLIPLVGAFLVLTAVADMLYRPSGSVGFALWFIQAFVLGTVVSSVLDRAARRALPLAALCNMSLVFPDQAPSRFGVALRTGSLRKLESRLESARADGLGTTETEAAVRAIEFVTMLSEHDRLTRGHTDRVRAYADLIAVELGLSEHERSRLAWGVMLHDIGKISVPSEVLNKSEKLTDDEWAALQGHPAAGHELLAPLSNWLGEWGLAASEHHERWDGGGYPRGLTGDEISMAGRITAVADAYDVITSKRSYKAPMSVEAARRELVTCAGSQFDPAVVRAFLNVSLGRRWLVGPLAVFSHLPLGQITTAPAVVSAGTLLTVGGVLALSPPTARVDALAFVEPPAISAEPAPETTTSTELALAEAAPTSEAAIETAAPASTTAAEPAISTTQTTAAAQSSTTVPVTSGAPTTALPTTAAPTTPTTSAPTTTAGPTTAAPTTTTTAAPTTTTAAPTTTTTAPTTTTTAATTTTTTLPGSLYHLKNPGSGNSTAQWFKRLELAGPDDASQPNFDTERDAIAGLSLASTGVGYGESDLAKIQRYGFDASGQTLTGQVSLTLYVATDNDLGGSPVNIRASLAECSSFYTTCYATLADTSASVSTFVGNGFEQISFDFGPVSHSFPATRWLVLRLITEEGEMLHIGFDADSHPSAMNLDLS